MTSSNAPVVNAASSESSQRIAPATSVGPPLRFMGILGASRSGRSGSPPAAWMSVRIRPGRTAFTRIPSSATSFARPIVIVSTAPFDAA